jgi:L-cysteine S-thiosulfotransferase
MRSRALWLAAACGVRAVVFGAAALALEAPIPRAALQSGSAFTSPQLRAMQDEDVANPGMLWVARGERLWRESAGDSGKACAACHVDGSMRGAATRYPRLDPGSARLVNLEARINLCRVRHQQAEPLTYESDALLALTAFVAHESRGMPLAVEIGWQERRVFARGRELYHRRIGQMNLACTHCHDRYWGRTLFNERLSQGHGSGFPAYRLEWQTLGSLQRRIRACYSGLRAEMPPYGATELLELELYLAWRATGLAIEAPAVRR